MAGPNFVAMRAPSNSPVLLATQCTIDERFLFIPIKSPAPIELWKVVDLATGEMVERSWNTFREAREDIFQMYYQE